MEKYPLISKINSPQDLKNFNIKELNNLASEIRVFLLDKISQNGGHLASNLGVVEATIALHYVFDSPKDKLIFDVGHQGYVHKILTGRSKEFDKLRKFNGLSGFLKESESEHDVFEAGHSSTSISAMAGFLEAKKTFDSSSKIDSNNIIGEVVSFIGDASLQSGIALSGINYLATKKDQKGIIILNDNEMSIGKNIGGFTNVFNNLRVKKSYRLIRKLTPKFIRNMMKTIVYGKLPLFSQLGYRYIGPIDGHNLKDMIKYFTFAKEQKDSIIVHIKTIKGKGYKFAEEDVIGKYHGINPFDLETGTELKQKPMNMISFSNATGKVLDRLLSDNSNNLSNKIKIITPSMTYGTGLTEISQKYPDKFLDLGICEENAIIMASSMSSCGIIPICLTYSTFYQRSYDQINHDVCRSNKHVIMLADRAGIVPNDGDTHQGIFDLSMLSPLPNIKICAPSNYDELNYVINYALADKVPYYIRYPKVNIINNINNNIAYNNEKWIILKDIQEINVLSYGPVINEIFDKIDGFNVGFINTLFIKPLDNDVLRRLKNKTLVIYEEVIRNGSLASMIKEYSNDFNLNIKIISFSLDNYIGVGSIDELRNQNNISIDNLINTIKKLTNKI